jgi:hypothetical protein
MSSREYLIVFDTNVLYVPYKDRADFTQFYFNSTFKNIVDKVEELDLYDNVKVGVPAVVWEEMIKQKCESYYEKIKDIKTKTDKFQFPFHKFVQIEAEEEYKEFLNKQMAFYRENLGKRLVKLIDIELPSSSRFESIVKRAFEKRPPFTGNNGSSDKGFKDALLWESILEFKDANKVTDILLYSDEKLFCSELVDELNSLWIDSNIKIFSKSDEDKLVKELEAIAIMNDQYVLIEDTQDELDHIKTWIYSESFKESVLRVQEKFDVVNKFTRIIDIEVEEIYDIEELDTENEFLKDLKISLCMKITYRILDKNEITEKYDLTIYGNIVDGLEYEIDDIEIENGGEHNE